MSKSMCNYNTMLLMLLLAVNSVSPGRAATLLRIDCGTDHSYTDTEGSLWQADGNFIRAGINAQISDYNDDYGQFNDLRVFKEQNKNCYTLPTPTLGRYFIRVAFFYGNYDGNVQAPTFDLQIDGNRWTTVVTTPSWPPVYYELIYPTQGNNVSVCLARTQDNQFPFISTLEIWPLVGGMYEHMPEDIAWHKSYRYNYGRDENPDDWITGYPTDKYNRIWEGYTLAGVTRHIAEASITDPTINYVPHDAITNAVEAYNEANSINLSFTFNKPDNLNYVQIYFTEIYSLSDNETRLIDIYVNGKYSVTTRPEYGYGTSVYGNLTSDENLRIQLLQNSSSQYPPVVSSIEVYTAGDPLVNVTTSKDDYGLETLIHAFAKLHNWSGDPCLPNTTVWQWLDCTGNNLPRVNKLELSGYGLDGLLPDFYQMQALEIIDLSSNSLHGPIPSFLGTLPNLKLLNLYGNNFNGKIPKSITNNKNLRVNVTGNPNLHHPKKKNLALIIGLSVGLPVGLILVVVACVLLLRRRRTPPVPRQPTSDGSGKPKPQIESNSLNTSTQIPTGTLGNIRQAQPAPVSNTNLTSSSNQMRIINPTINGAVNSGNMSVLPGINKEELDELLDLHNKSR